MASILRGFPRVPARVVSADFVTGMAAAAPGYESRPGDAANREIL